MTKEDENVYVYADDDNNNNKPYRQIERKLRKKREKNSGRRFNFALDYSRERDLIYLIFGLRPIFPFGTTFILTLLLVYHQSEPLH